MAYRTNECLDSIMYSVMGRFTNFYLKNTIFILKVIFRYCFVFIDIDECKLGTGNCEQRCENNDGSYSCFCHLGYRINDDRRTCSKGICVSLILST